MKKYRTFTKLNNHKKKVMETVHNNNTLNTPTPDANLEQQNIQRMKNEALGLCLVLALELEKEFKLYSYRIIDQSGFIANTYDIAKQTIESLKQLDAAISS